MKYFESANGIYHEKHNFVDEHNVFVGYDSTHDCCEHADWFLSPEPKLEFDAYEDTDKELDWENWEFDTTWKVVEAEPEHLEYGGVAIFRLRRNDGGSSRMYLHLFNSQNGYYGHGFEYKVPKRSGVSEQHLEGML